MAIQRFSADWGGKQLIIETGRYAAQANGACTVQYGDTVVLACATMGHDPREGIDFFPLSVEYEEKLYAAGKIKSSRFIKREGRPTDEAVMTGRMIDRTIRPMFPNGVHHEVQVVIEVLSVDLENDSDIPALIGASCALAISDIPWDGPLAGVRIGRIGGEWVLNPTFEARGKSDLDLIVAGTEDRVLMIEAGAKEVSEADVNAGILFGQKHLRKVRELILEVQNSVGLKKIDPKILTGEADETDDEKKEKEELAAKTNAFIQSRGLAVLFSGPKVSKGERQAAVGKLKAELEASLKEEEIGKDKRKIAIEAFDTLVEEAVSKAILAREQRVDGRSLTDIRPLQADVALL
ncbi:MAG: polyribonucleotide nucleotidyltransferase, partial [Patescibacteria group bacterium]